MRDGTCCGFTCRTMPAPPPAHGGGMMGGSTTIDITDPDLASAAKFAMHTLNAKSNSAFELMTVQIVSATKQVVAGTKYTIEIDAGESSCSKMAMHTKTLALCPVSHPMRYSVVVVDRAWMHPRYHLLSNTVAEIPAAKPAGSAKADLPSFPVGSAAGSAAAASPAVESTDDASSLHRGMSAAVMAALACAAVMIVVIGAVGAKKYFATQNESLSHEEVSQHETEAEDAQMLKGAGMKSSYNQV